MTDDQLNQLLMCGDVIIAAIGVLVGCILTLLVGVVLHGR